MKYLVSGNKAINLSNADEITISCNYLKITTGGGLNAREVSFVYGTEAELVTLFSEIMDFIEGEGRIFDCDKFIKRFRTAQ